ncbi:MAG TPA: type IV pilin [Methanocorpusculum sp.]|nr:type IV pilin [Methanocorpusculum sp.]
MKKEKKYCVCLITERNRCIHRKNDAVSPVIGTVLLIALVVIIIAICASVFMINSVVETPYITGVSISQQENTILITYLGGDSIEGSNLKIMADDFDVSSLCTGLDGVFGPGSVLAWDSKAFSVDYVSVVAVNPSTSSEQLIVQKNVNKDGELSIGESTSKVIKTLNENFKVYGNISDIDGDWIWNENVMYYVPLDGHILTYGGIYWIVTDRNSKMYKKDIVNKDFTQVIIGIPYKLQIKVDMIYTIDNSGVINGEVSQGALCQNGNRIYVYKGSNPTHTFWTGDNVNWELCCKK